MVAGATLGVATNATIWSVRFRNNCLFDSPEASLSGAAAVLAPDIQSLAHCMYS